MYRFLYYLIQPGVVSTGLIGTALQVGLAFANTFNIAGAADMIANYGMNGQLASGGLIAALTGAYYSLTQRKSGRAVATGAGAVAGGISGTLGTAITQSIGLTELADGMSPVLNLPAVGTALIGLVSGGDQSVPAGTEQMFDTAMLTQVFGSTAAGGGIGALLGRFVFGGGGKRAHA